jgi:hypothetical protein
MLLFHPARYFPAVVMEKMAAPAAAEQAWAMDLLSIRAEMVLSAVLPANLGVAHHVQQPEGLEQVDMAMSMLAELE